MCNHLSTETIIVEQQYEFDHLPLKGRKDQTQYAFVVLPRASASMTMSSVSLRSKFTILDDVAEFYSGCFTVYTCFFRTNNNIREPRSHLSRKSSHFIFQSPVCQSRALNDEIPPQKNPTKFPKKKIPTSCWFPENGIADLLSSF